MNIVMRFIKPVVALLCVVDCVVVESKPVRPAAKIEPVIQEGHPWDGSEPEIAVSPNGSWLVSSSSTRKKLWNSQGELLCDLTEPVFGGQFPIFSLDNRQFYLTGKKGTAIYELPSGRKIRDIQGATLSSDTRFYIRRNDKTIRFSDARTGKQLATVAAHPASSWEETLNFSPDGNFVAAGQTISADSDGKMRIWNIKTGKLVWTLSDPRGGFGKSNGVIGPALWSSDGRTLVTGGEDPNWRIPSDDGGPKTPAFYQHAYAVKVWDMKTGKMLRVWPGYGSIDSGVPLLQFRGSQEVLLKNGKNKALVLNTNTGKVVSYSSAIPSKKPQAVYLNNDTGYFELRDRNGQRTLQSYPTKGFAGFDHIAYSPDGVQIAAAEENGKSIRIYEASSGTLRYTLKLSSSYGEQSVHSLKWLADGNLSAASLQSAWIWQPDGKLILHFVPPTTSKQGYKNGVSVSPDGRFFLCKVDLWSRNDRRTACVYNSKGEVLREIAEFSQYDPSDAIWIDNARVAIWNDKGFKVWNIEKGTLESTINRLTGFHQILPVVASSDGAFLLCREDRIINHVLRWRTVLFETKNWRRVRVYEDSSPLAWSSDSKKFLARGRNGEEGAQVFSIESQNPLKKTAFFANQQGQIAFSPDLEFAVMKNRNYVATHSEIWRVSTGKVAVALYLFGEGKEAGTSDAKRSWLALTPKGFYDGSDGIERWLRWRRNDVLLPVGTFQKERRNPSKVRAALQ